MHIYFVFSLLLDARSLRKSQSVYEMTFDEHIKLMKGKLLDANVFKKTQNEHINMMEFTILDEMTV